MRSTKTTIRFKLSRAEDARALEYLRNRKKKAYWLHRQGKKTHRDMLREDVEYCLT